MRIPSVASSVRHLWTWDSTIKQILNIGTERSYCCHCSTPLDCPGASDVNVLASTAFAALSAATIPHFRRSFALSLLLRLIQERNRFDCCILASIERQYPNTPDWPIGLRRHTASRRRENLHYNWVSARLWTKRGTIVLDSFAESVGQQDTAVLWRQDGFSPWSRSIRREPPVKGRSWSFVDWLK